MPNDISATTGGNFYSGSVSDIKKIMSIIDVGAGRLAEGGGNGASIGEETIAFYQEMVDRDIDSILEPTYWVPLVPVNQCQPDGVTRKILPGKIVKAARYWTAGLILREQFSKQSQNSNESADQYIEEAKRDIFMIARYNIRLYGQRRKSNLSRTLPPGLQPPAIMEQNF